jgi:hypothetical protein
MNASVKQGQTVPEAVTIYRMADATKLMLLYCWVLVLPQIHHSCFFKGAESLRGSDSSNEAWLVANPPYIPAPDSDILMPELHG